MKLKLLATSALAISLAFSAAADVTEKKFDAPKLEDKLPAKEIATVDEMKDLFNDYQKKGDHEIRFTSTDQQARIGQKGNRNDAAINQTYSEQGLAQIRQQGGRNDATATQRDGAGNSAFENPLNLAVIDQVKDNNVAVSNQTHRGGRTNVVEIHQVSIDYNPYKNVADAYQDGGNLSSLINQEGVANSAYSTQTGRRQTSVIDQRGALNYADTYQHTGTDNSSQTVQIGYGGYENAAYVEQSGSWNDSVLQQEGDGNYGEVYQSGDDNKSFVDQLGWYHEAAVTQSGDFNNAILQQDGTNNDAAITQSSDYNLAFIDQSGIGNTATASQVYSDYNQSLIVQSGNANYASTHQ